MKHQPIKIPPLSFSELLAGKVHDGSKTMTRRVVTNVTDVTDVTFDGVMHWGCKYKKGGFEYSHHSMTEGPWLTQHCPYAVGQLLYVREPHCAYGEWVQNGLTKTGKHKFEFHYHDDQSVTFDPRQAYENNSYRHKAMYKRLARFMPKKYARTFLRVTEVRCERLLDIGEDDAIREGIELVPNPNGRKGYDDEYIWKVGDKLVNGSRDAFFHLWDSINGKDSHLLNPWVWVVSFERVEMPNPWNNEQVYDWGWKKAMVGYVSEACSGLVLQAVPEIGTEFTVAFLNETRLGRFGGYGAAQLACQDAARKHYIT